VQSDSVSPHTAAVSSISSLFRFPRQIRYEIGDLITMMIMTVTRAAAAARDGMCTGRITSTRNAKLSKNCVPRRAVCLTFDLVVPRSSRILRVPAHYSCNKMSSMRGKSSNFAIFARESHIEIIDTVDWKNFFSRQNFSDLRNLQLYLHEDQLYG